MQRLIVGLTTVLLASSCTGDPPAEEAPYPPPSRVLASATGGGWSNIDFVHSGDALLEAQRCVRSRTGGEAVACYAFTTQSDRAHARPVEAGSFKGPLCWTARWQRNKAGAESGGVNRFKPDECPSAIPQRTQPVEPPTAPVAAGPLRVELDFNVVRSPAGQARIVGNTNLPDGTALSFSVSSTERSYLAQEKGRVIAGEFASAWFSFRGQPFPTGAYEIGVTVPFYNAQPPSVKAVLGDRLENMEGPLVNWLNPQMHELGKVASTERVIRF